MSSPNEEAYPIDLYLNGKTPQQVIRLMNGIIGRAKQEDKANLVIEEYEETYGNPFCQNPDRCLRVRLK